MENYDLVIVGGGPAGLAAAISARKDGIQSILVLERDDRLGGILNQCIHNGFGLHTFNEELTGPEYAGRFISQLLDEKIEYRLNTMVMDISHDRVVTAMNSHDGLFQIQAKAVVLAMGCRERSRLCSAEERFPYPRHDRFLPFPKAGSRPLRLSLCRERCRCPCR